MSVPAVLSFGLCPRGVSSAEWQACLSALDEREADYVVASGSLPRGVPTDFYLEVAQLAARKQAKLILDTSGEALRQTLSRGVYLVKPSLGELEYVVGGRLTSRAQQENAVRGLVASGAAEMVALTLGRDGALLATRQGLHRLEGLEVAVNSAVGAGDSFLAGITWALRKGATGIRHLR